jgi:MHS family proline/betaine transporter-like MFS transporter
MLNYMPTFLVKFAGLSQSQALWGNAIALAVLVAATPLFGLLSDRIGRKPLLLACCAAFVILPYPVFSIILNKASFPTIVCLQIFINLFIAAFSGAGPAALAELFPTHSRTLLMSVGYSLSVAIFGGFAPYIATWLIERTGSPIAPTYYLIASGIISGFVIWSFRETAHEELR